MLRPLVSVSPANLHKLGDLKQQKCILSQVKGLEVRSQSAGSDGSEENLSPACLLAPSSRLPAPPGDLMSPSLRLRLPRGFSVSLSVLFCPFQDIVIVLRSHPNPAWPLSPCPGPQRPSSRARSQPPSLRVRTRPP